MPKESPLFRHLERKASIALHCLQVPVGLQVALSGQPRVVVFFMLLRDLPLQRLLKLGYNQFFLTGVLLGGEILGPKKRMDNKSIFKLNQDLTQQYSL